MNRAVYRTALQRIGTGERWWAAEIAVRSAGMALLGGCLASAAALHRSLQQPSHPLTTPEFALAALAVLGWWFGWAALIEGPGLFRLVPVPGRGWMA
ncbi:hypothetical protein P1X14_02355 [Sphingomonas sp. AOB5]|uniref:hypothetical protein n=1 Tax=Sphingomonas sp. AOB5 TaxID=3034017 RepID=UPI0023F90B76|nr:hypothetical protein [Sphingomonas sp. AOB5]MDF7774076.1 hypothetical protein [Sphingomonas sp. AOB5]